ncbi:hypothetical protein [Pleionea sediminis]|uniref:hypothetical protein n=1 Tax=Pleionea sediminis TaxID=2569479 RepID=UPI0011871258|nr:hypothetical protein [Pleionea sediminis]
MVKHPENPTCEEIEEWAYSDEEAPHQEWELFLIWKQEFELDLKFASDILCPKEEFFLNLLYYWVWQNIKHEYKDSDLDNHKALFKQAAKVNTPYVKIWLKRSLKLIDDKNSYSEEEWWADRRPFDVKS